MNDQTVTDTNLPSVKSTETNDINQNHKNDTDKPKKKWLSKLKLSDYLWTLMAFLLVSAAGSYYFKKTTPKLSAVTEQMRTEPSLWAKEEKSLTNLLIDVKADQVTAIGVAQDGLLVSTKPDGRYYVAGKSNTLLPLVSGYVEKGASFELASLPQHDERWNPRHNGFNIRAIWPTLSDSIFWMLSVAAVALLVLICKDKGSTNNLFGSSKLLETRPDINFDDVIGAGEAKAALNDVVNYLKNPQLFKDLGARAPAGILMLGDPGVGKTLLAKALAGECGANFIESNGSDFSSKYYGAGISKVKKLFATARKNAPCILFIDEIDGISKRTSTEGGPVEGENNRIINQVLIEMDGFNSNEGVVVIGATNLIKNMDPALLREGRFDRRITIRKPDMIDRAEIIRHYSQKITLDAQPDFDQLARLTSGFSPAALSHIVNNAALIASRDGASAVKADHFLESIETAHMGELNGGERAMSSDERHRIAIHESGHAIVAAALKTGTVEKVTILPRGGALGVTLVTDQQDKMLQLRSEIENRIKMLLGGRNAEIIALGEASSGASHDLQEASRLAMQMVGNLGFSKEGSLFSIAALPPEMAAFQTADIIKQANVLLDDLNEQCKAIIVEKRSVLDALSQELLDIETVPGSRVLQLMT